VSLWLVESDNYEAFSYYISQSADSELVDTWIKENPEKMQRLNEWLKK